MHDIYAVSAVDVEDNFTSENSIDDLSAAPDESNDITESDVLGSDSVEPTVISDTFDEDELSDDEPETTIDFTLKPYYPIGYDFQAPEVWGYRENIEWYLDIDVTGAPAKDVDFKFTMDGLNIITPKIDDGHSTWYGVNYTFDPDTGIVHFDELKDYGNIFISMSFGFYTEITKIGNVTMTAELDYGNSKKNITITLPTKMGEVDLDLIKSTHPFSYPSWVIFSSPNPELLGSMDIVPLTDDWDDDDWDDEEYPPRIYQLGDVVVWYVRVTNNGEYTAFDVNITDILPDGLIYNSHEVRTGSFGSYYVDTDFSENVTYDEENNVLHVPQMLRTQFVDLILVTTINATGNITNVGTVTSDNIELNREDNTGNATIKVLGPDLIITKSAWTDYEAMMNNASYYGNYSNTTTPIIKVNDSVYWLIVVTNKGFETKNVVVSDLLPEGLEIESAETEFGSYDIESNTWTIGSLGFTKEIDIGFENWKDKFAEDFVNKNFDYTFYWDFPYSWTSYTNKIELLSDPEFIYEMDEMYDYIRDYAETGEDPYDIAQMYEFEDIEIGNTEVLNFDYLIIKTKALSPGEFINYAAVTSEYDDENLTDNEANATVIVEEEKVLKETIDEPQPENTTAVEENQTTRDNSPSNIPDEDPEPKDKALESSVSKTVQPLGVKAATGNPILLALVALFIVTGNIFRRKEEKNKTKIK